MTGAAFVGAIALAPQPGEDDRMTTEEPLLADKVDEEMVRYWVPQGHPDITIGQVVVARVRWRNLPPNVLIKPLRLFDQGGGKQAYEVEIICCAMCRDPLSVELESVKDWPKGLDADTRYFCGVTCQVVWDADQHE